MFFLISFSSATNLHQSTANDPSATQPSQTFNLLDSLPEQTRSSPIPYNPFAYIEFEHDYAMMTRQPVLIAKRLTVDGLNDMGVQPPMVIVPKPKFPAREHDAEMRIMYELDQGVDDEDLSFLKQSFQRYSFPRPSKIQTISSRAGYARKDIRVPQKRVGLITLPVVIPRLSNHQYRNIEQVSIFFSRQRDFFIHSFADRMCSN